eukprot:312880_1
MSSHDHKSMSYVQLKDVSISYGCGFRHHPFSYCNNIFIVLHSKLSKYNTLTNEYDTNYDTNYPLSLSSQIALNRNNNTLYSFKSPYTQLSKYNLNTKMVKRITFENEEKQNYHYYPNYNFSSHPTYAIICYVGIPFNEVHIIWSDWLRSYHMKYNPNNDQLIKLKAINLDGNKPFSESKMIYIESQQRLMLFGGIKGYRGYQNPKLRNSIYYTDIFNKKQIKYKWYKLNGILPYKYVHPCHYDIIEGYDGLIFLFYFLEKSNTEIWCLNT